MTNRLVIAGAGGFGRGVFGWLTQSPRDLHGHGISDIVFISDDEPPVAAPAPIIGTVEAYEPSSNDLLICAIGDPRDRFAVVEHLTSRGARFHTFIDPRAVVGAGVRIGAGAIICPGVVISANARLADHVHINFNSSIGHDTELGSWTTLSPAVNIMGGVTVGEGAFFGGSAAVLPRISVGDWSVVGAGAVVVNSVLPGRTVMGNPAREHEQASNPGS